MRNSERKTMRKIVPVILCGGSGTRLWPISRKETPKQFLRLMDDDTLLQKTAKRIMSVLGTDGSDLVTITLRGMHDETKRQLGEVSPALSRHLLLEPQARNTSAATAFAIHYVQDNFGEDAILWILPSDHYIGDEACLAEAVDKAAEAAEDGYMVTFGIHPTRPETGYGYVRKSKRLNGSEVYGVKSFVEKPSYEKAEKLVKAKDYLWSSGMHLFQARTGREGFCMFAPQTWIVVRNAMMESTRPDRPALMTYGAVKEEPFEKAVLEKAENIAVVPCDPQWSDIGCWESLWEIKEKDQHGNACNGNVLCHDTKNSMILAEDRLVTCVGLEDIIVIETGDSLLIADKKSNDSIKALVQKLQQSNRRETVSSDTLQHGWGQRRLIVSASGMKLFENVIRPENKISGTINDHSTQWIVAAGIAAVEVDGSVTELSKDETFRMARGTNFCVTNSGSGVLKIYELQTVSQNRAAVTAPSRRKPLSNPARKQISDGSQKVHAA